jgi:signal transduction histidine kinase
METDSPPPPVPGTPAPLPSGPAVASPGVAADVQRVSRLAAVPKILEAVTHATGMRFAAVARVTDSTWTACAVYDDIDFGLQPGGQLALETTLCNEIRQHRRPIVFGQASADPQFANHHTPALYGFESYISVPIVLADGSFFGTLCAIDPRPARLDAPVLRTLELFADLVAAQLDLEGRLEASDGALHAAEDTAKLRDQFVAVLGHDLRGPLQAMQLGTEMLRQAPLNARWEHHLDRMQRSGERMAELIRNVLDLARGRLGGGIPVDRRRDDRVWAELQQVLAEVQSVHPGRVIAADFANAAPVRCDASRVAQLFSNLLANAISHGDPAQPVRVQARSDGDGFVLRVHNAGTPIEPDTQARLFEPFWRGGDEQGTPSLAMGLGLGLYIAAEIAKAHGGTLRVDSSAAAGTLFEFLIPA